MEITLIKEDIESIIKERYDGVSEIKFNSKNIKAILTVKDITKFAIDKKKQINTQPVQQLPEKTLEERNNEAKAKGLMVAGGAERTLMRF